MYFTIKLNNFSLFNVKKYFGEKNHNQNQKNTQFKPNITQT